MNRLCLLVVLAVLFSVAAFAGADSAVLGRLVGRYGFAYAWGQGYWVRANGYYAFAGKDGRLKTGFKYRNVDTVLNDRALACGDVDCNFNVVVDDSGREVTYADHKFRLMNRSKRIFACAFSDGGELLYSDNGRQLTFQAYNPGEPEEAMMLVWDLISANKGYGIINHRGDTVLPTRYQGVSFGYGLYSYMQNDTAYIFDRSGKLRGSMGGIHECRIVGKDRIAVKKYGAYALATVAGKLLTGFVYPAMGDYKDMPVAMPPYTVSGDGTPPLRPYAAIGDAYHTYRLIDEIGADVFPIAYDDIKVNGNGWFLVSTGYPAGQQLLDARHNVILKTEAYSMRFEGDRYVRADIRARGDYDENIKWYDVVKRRFVRHGAANAREDKPAASKRSGDVDKDIVTTGYNADSFIINQGASVLKKVNGKWGVRSVTGDVITPFIYEYAGSYGYKQFYIGSDGKHAKLNDEGELCTPMDLPFMPWYVSGDSLVTLSNSDVYSFKGGHSHKVEKREIQEELPRVQASGMVYYDGGKQLRRGVYNRRGQWLAWKLVTDHSDGIMKTGLASVADSLGECYTVIDSNGMPQFASISKPKKLMLYGHCALAMYDTGKNDVLYRFANGQTLIDTIRIDSVTKRTELYPAYIKGRFEPVYRNDKSIFFAGRHGGQGVVSPGTGVAVLDKRYEKILAVNQYLYIKTGNKWGIYTQDATEVLAPGYDSIAYPRGNAYYLLFSGGKVGLFNGYNKRVFPEVYDAIPYPESLNDNFLIVYKDGKATVLDGSSKMISGWWDDAKPVNYNTVAGLAVRKNGLKYKLQVLAGADTLTAVPDIDLPPGVEIDGNQYDGVVHVVKDKLKGVYDIPGKKWIVPARFEELEAQDHHYFGHTTVPNVATVVYNAEGGYMFSLACDAYMRYNYESDQWDVSSAHGPKVVNNQGKTIVPDSFTHAYMMYRCSRRLYMVMNRAGKRGLIDTTGRIMIPAILDDVSDDDCMVGGYLKGYKDGKYSIITPAGKMITECVYATVSEGFKWDNEQDSEEAGDMTADLHPYFIVSLADSSGYGVLDSTGHTLIPCKYDHIEQVHLGKIAVVRQGGKWGLISLRNKAVTGFKYDEIGVFYKGRASFRRGGSSGTLDVNGKETMLWQR